MAGLAEEGIRMDGQVNGKTRQTDSSRRTLEAIRRNTKYRSSHTGSGVLRPYV